ncbi:MAG: phytanoyl-CoA dioxygenase family protein [Nostoc sp. DedQUE05]|uniref:phytanoyl-CoA dioxygenase family protein n=1 Tax=Nostoc sp. DedQUE05 TaxID=3075391 RepID=UPI002AD4F7F0|nr:phytanoyl-CoA dioxygenase family protein [Nostoc sp. DedQUE05]MDZ8090958.1 phytanoyl-CoA dioxygenase family protein [Nostoc sp. DedQUE05]
MLYTNSIEKTVTLTAEQIKDYRENGLLFIPELFSQKEVEAMHVAVEDLIVKDTPGRILEKDNTTVRALHGCHLDSETFNALTRHPSLLTSAYEILNSDVYVYQFKINFKAAFGGDLWPWHQDFVFWDEEDGMPSPKALNVAVFLDECNEFNGPVYFIPGSHKESLFHLGQIKSSEVNGQEKDWKSNVSAALKYSLDKETIAKLADEKGIVAPKGPSGSVLFFHCNLVHGSAPNISPYDRRLLIITYNSINNIPTFKGQPRPEFLVSRDHTPLKLLCDKVLI